MYDKFIKLDARIHETHKSIRERERILSIMELIDSQLHVLETDLLKLEGELVNKERDVEKLEAVSFESLYYRFMGRKDAQLEKELQEYADAKIAAEACKLQIASLNSNLRKFEEILVEIADCDEEYEQLKHEQIKLLAELNNPKGNRLQELTSNLALTSERIKEASEALEVGQIAIEGINQTISILKQGRNRVGTWSMQYNFSGSSDPVGQAIKIANYTQPFLDKFQLELADISQQFSVAPDMKIPEKPDMMFVQFTSGLAGNRFTDISAQPEIKHWFIHLQRLQKKVSVRITLLKEWHQSLSKSLMTIEEEKSELISELWDQSIFQGF